VGAFGASGATSTVHEEGEILSVVSGKGKGDRLDTYTMIKINRITHATEGGASIVLEGNKIIIRADDIEIRATHENRIYGNKIKMNP
jgi:hypothetical protein